MAVPANSPVMVPDVTCSGCSGPTRKTIESMANGRYLRTIYSCDKCQAAFAPSTMYLMGEYVAYKAPGAPQTVAPSVPQEAKSEVKAPAPVPTPKPVVAPAATAAAPAKEVVSA